MSENLLRNLFRVGDVSDVDPAKCRVRVAFSDLDGTVSNWLNVLVRGAGGNKDYWLPDVGEQVLCLLMPTGNAEGYVLGSIYSDQVPPPVGDQNKRHVTFADGTVVEYDRGSSTLTVNCSGTVNINAPSGDVVVNGISLVNHTHPESIGTVTGPPG